MRMSCDLKMNVSTFNRDVASNGGYLYTTNARLSSRLSNERITKATLAMADLRGRRIIDIGCGDGAYTIELHDRGGPALIHGIDPAGDAIASAHARIAGRKMLFSVGNAYELDFPDGAFDVAHLRGVLHHLDRPLDALREALRVASKILVIEPNGYNPIVKLLERFSQYHLDHEEKSYAPHSLDRWVRELGGKVTKRSWIGLVPFFCPDLFARCLKLTEPLVEHTPLARALCCGQYVFTANS
jgi:SAM-dependent methyltransferase